MSRHPKPQKFLEKENARTMLAPPLSGRFSRKEGPKSRTRKGTHPPKDKG